jgi:hypothetical protein
MKNSVKMTKKERAFELFENNIKSKNQKISNVDLINLFVTNLKTTEGAARTYLSYCNKKYANSYGLKYITRNINKSDLKREKAIEIFNNNPSLSRIDMIDKFQTELNMTRNSAATHCSYCSKRYKGPKHNAVIYR